MTEAIVSFHKDRSPLATCSTNTQCKVIDRIWTSPDIHILRCDFFPFHDFLGFISDHRLIWADICNQSLYGHRPQRIFRAPALRVKSNDPAFREKYAKRLLEQYERKGLVHKFGALDQLRTLYCQGEDIGADIASLHSDIAESTLVIRKTVNKSLCKFYQGYYSWSPFLQSHNDRVEYW